jgi:putative oxidoreductase
MTQNYSKYAPTVLRVALGMLFLIPGLTKLANPGMIQGMLTGMGMPVSGLLGWVVILAEVLGGAALIAGYKTKTAVWPLLAVLGVATVAVHLPALGESPMSTVNLLFHILGLAGLVSIYLSGPGEHAYGSK